MYNNHLDYYWDNIFSCHFVKSSSSESSSPEPNEFKSFKNDAKDIGIHSNTGYVYRQMDSPSSGNGPIYNRRLGSRTYLVDENSELGAQKGQPWKNVNENVSSKLRAASSDSPPLIPKRDYDESPTPSPRNKRSSVEDQDDNVDDGKFFDGSQFDHTSDYREYQMDPMMVDQVGMQRSAGYPPEPFPPYLPPHPFAPPPFFPPMMYPEENNFPPPPPLFPPPMMMPMDFEMFAMEEKKRKHKRKINRSKSFEYAAPPLPPPLPPPFFSQPPPPFMGPPPPFMPMPPPPFPYGSLLPLPSAEMVASSQIPEMPYQSQALALMPPPIPFHPPAPPPLIPYIPTPTKSRSLIDLPTKKDTQPNNDTMKKSNKESEKDVKQKSACYLMCCKGFTQILWVIIGIILIGLILGLVLGLTLV